MRDSLDNLWRHYLRFDPPILREILGEGCFFVVKDLGEYLLFLRSQDSINSGKEGS